MKGLIVALFIIVALVVGFVYLLWLTEEVEALQSEIYRLKYPDADLYDMFDDYYDESEDNNNEKP